MATAREDLLKSIDSRISVEFADYEQWTRKTKPTKTHVKSDGLYSLFVNQIQYYNFYFTWKKIYYNSLEGIFNFVKNLNI
jgi:hypothetical protein